MDRKLFEQTLRRTFWIPFGIAVIVGATLILEVRFLIDRAAWVEHTDQVITLAQRIYRSRIDQETGLRAYVLTHDERFLAPFYGGRKQALVTEPDLRKLIADNPEQIARNEESIRAFQAWSDWADQAIAITKAGGDAGSVTFQLRGKELMDNYRGRRTGFIESEQALRDQRLDHSRSAQELLNSSVVALTILSALGFAFLGRQQLMGLSRSFTEVLNSVQEQRDWFHTTLTSIGDAVIATDGDGRITLMNRVAEDLTGWPLQGAQGKPLSEVFRIVNQQTRKPVEDPVEKVRRLKQVVGLANHTILISRSGQEFAIDDSGAPIFGPEGALAGIVLVFRDVTEQREAERATARLAAIVEYSGDAVITKSLDGILQTWNAGAERLFGYTAAEVIGQPVTILLPPDRPDEEAEILQRIRQGRPSERLETVRVAKDGRQVRVSVGVSPIKDPDGRVIGASKVIHDISELAAAREELIREKEWLRTTLTSIGDAVISTDSSGLVTLMNLVAEQLTGWPLQDALGKPLAEIFNIVNQETREPVENPVDKVRRLNRVVGLANHTILISKNGQEIAIDDSGAPIFGPDGALTGVVLVFRDVNEARKAEEALRRNAERFRTLANALPQLCWMANADGWIYWYNKRWYEYTGATPEQMEGWGWQSVHDPAALPKVIERWKASIATGEPFEMVFPLRGGDGIFRPFLTRVIAIKDSNDKVVHWFGTNTDITELRKSEQNARDAQERLSRLIDSAMDAVVVVDAQQRIVLFNPSAEQMFRCPASEATGSLLERFIPDRFRGAHRRHLEKFGETGVTNRSMSRPGTLWGLRESGEEFPIEATISQVTVGDRKLFTVILRDITERKRAEAELQTERDRLSLALTTGRMGVYEMDLAQNAIWLSPESYSLLGTTPHDFSAAPDAFVELVHPQDRELLLQHIKGSIEAHGAINHEFRILLFDGRECWVSCQGQVEYNEEGRAVRHSGLLVDITSRKQSEQMVRRFERLSAAARLSAAMAHEINNPLAGVVNLIYLARTVPGTSDGVVQLLAKAEQELERVAHAARQTLGFYRESSAPEQIDIPALIESVLELYSTKLVSKHISIERAFGECAAIQGVRGEVRQAISNVIVNAIDAVAKGGVIVIGVHSVPGDKPRDAEIVIADNGPGIAVGDVDKVFEPFFTTKGPTGIGLGLWVTKDIVERHGGTISVSPRTDGSELGGATVTIRFPRTSRLRRGERKTSAATISKKDEPTVLDLEDNRKPQ